MHEGPHVLVAEDELLAALALEDFLREKGYRVTLAANGVEALAAFERDRPNVLLTDLNMPRMNGVELIRRIRAADARVPIIVMTGYRGMLPADTERLLGDARADVLDKPLDLLVVETELKRLA